MNDIAQKAAADQGTKPIITDTDLSQASMQSLHFSVDASSTNPLDQSVVVSAGDRVPDPVAEKAESRLLTDFPEALASWVRDDNGHLLSTDDFLQQKIMALGLADPSRQYIRLDYLAEQLSREVDGTVERQEVLAFARAVLEEYQLPNVGMRIRTSQELDILTACPHHCKSLLIHLDGREALHAGAGMQSQVFTTLEQSAIDVTGLSTFNLTVTEQLVHYMNPERGETLLNGNQVMQFLKDARGLKHLCLQCCDLTNTAETLEGSFDRLQTFSAKFSKGGIGDLSPYLNAGQIDLQGFEIGEDRRLRRYLYRPDFGEQVATLVTNPNSHVTKISLPDLTFEANVGLLDALKQAKPKLVALQINLVDGNGNPTENHKRELTQRFKKALPNTHVSS